MPPRPFSTRDLVPGFAALVTARREEMRISRAELARRCGVSSSTVNAVEKEERAVSLRVASLIARELDLRVWLHSPTEVVDTQ
jgi:DNA-binding XRE family transcriptional regulator